VSEHDRSVAQLAAIINSNQWLMDILRAVREVDPPNWLVGSGVIRNVVWDHLHRDIEPTPTRDVDVAYFDRGDLSAERERSYCRELAKRRPDVAWEVTNQAGVHLWYQQRFGAPIPEARSVEDAIARWPETATAVGVRLRPDDSLYVVAPCGLEDLLAMVLRRNPRQVSREFFAARVIDKRIRETWPGVRVVFD
jgi:uncharacterized protein